MADAKGSSSAGTEMLRRLYDARVYGGIHFRFDQDGGNLLGRSVATYVIKNNLEPIHP